MAFGKQLRHIALSKQALATEAGAMRKGARLELLAWQTRLSALSRAVDLAVPLLAVIGLLRH